VIPAYAGRVLGEPLFDYTLLALFGTAVVVLLALVFLTAPYGRHQRGGWGPGIPARIAWVVMELPAVVGFGFFFFLRPRSTEVVPLVLLGFWMLHYVDRTFLYPLRIRPGGKPTPWLVAGWGFAFQLANAYVNGTWIATEEAGYEVSWLWDPRFLGGAALFLFGFFGNRWADHVLRNLRKPGETGYKIPRGGLYERISCPNYFTELTIWCGWALMTWSLAGLSFAVFTFANLVPRAVAHHRWYQEKFEDYPAKRRAVIPFVL